MQQSCTIGKMNVMCDRAGHRLKRREQRRGTTSMHRSAREELSAQQVRGPIVLACLSTREMCTCARVNTRDARWLTIKNDGTDG